MIGPTPLSATSSGGEDRGGWLTSAGREVGQKKEARSKDRRPLGSRPCSVQAAISKSCCPET